MKSPWEDCRLGKWMGGRNRAGGWGRTASAWGKAARGGQLSVLLLLLPTWTNTVCRMPRKLAATAEAAEVSRVQGGQPKSPVGVSRDENRECVLPSYPWVFTTGPLPH